MARRDNNALADLMACMKGLWLRRGGRIPEAVIDTLDALYPDENKRPVIVKRINQQGNWLFILSLRPGDNFQEFRRLLLYFQESCAGAVQIEKQGRAIMLRVMTEELRTSYPVTANANCPAADGVS